MSNNIKKCSKCKLYKDKSSEFFYRDSSKKDGFKYWCKSCVDAYNPKKYKYDSNKHINSLQTGKELIYAKRRLYEYMRRDKIRNMENDLDEKFFLDMFSLPCSYCGFRSTGLDRKDNTRGHTKENCVPCCMECNTARMDNFSYEEMLIIGESIRKVKLMRLNNHD